MATLPREIRNLIYIQWATNNLRALCTHNSIDYYRLSEFLQNHRGLIYGPTALSCFGYTPTPVYRIYIFIPYLYTHISAIGMELKNLCPNSVTIDSVWNNTDLRWEINIFRKSPKIIEVWIENQWHVTPKNFLLQTSILDYTGIAYDGKEWITLVPDTVQLVEGNVATINRISKYYSYDFEMLNLSPIVNLISTRPFLSKDNVKFINLVLKKCCGTPVLYYIRMDGDSWLTTRLARYILLFIGHKFTFTNLSMVMS